MKKQTSSYRCTDIRATKGKDIVGQIPYDSPSEDLGNFVEILKPGCFRNALDKATNIAALWNHDTGKPIGSTRAGTLSFSDSKDGLRVRITPNPNTSWGQNALQAVKRGDIAGLSFGFNVKKEGVEWIGNNMREIREVNELFEVSPVIFPAYQETCLQLRYYNCEAGRSRYTQSVLRDMKNFFGIRNTPKRTNQSLKSLREFFGMPDRDRHQHYRLAGLRNFFNKGRTKEDFKDFFSRGGRTRYAMADLKRFFK